MERSAKTYAGLLLVVAAAGIGSFGACPNPALALSDRRESAQSDGGIALSGLAQNQLPAGSMPCTDDSECSDQNACTGDRCIENLCSYSKLPNCVPCNDNQVCAPLEVVFVMDTSGSMVDQAAALCTQTARVIDTLADVGITVEPTFLGITQNPGGPFSCLSGHVAQFFGEDVPGPASSCQFPNGTAPQESWGPATAIVAERFAWKTGSLRIIIPLGDESPCNGDGPAGCNDPGDDRSATENAIEVASKHRVMVSPIIGSGATPCTLNLADDLAKGTGGVALQTPDPNSDLTDVLLQVLVQACVMSEECDDLDPCTDHDSCESGVCSGLRLPNCTRCANDTECNDHISCTTDLCEADICHSSVTAACVSCTTHADCDDGNSCTMDACMSGLCDSEANYDSDSTCCNPSTGVVTSIDDANPCTIDLCNSDQGTVSHAIVPPGTFCDDGDPCTVDDYCDEVGGCAGTDVNGEACDRDEDCSPAVCDRISGQCDCGEVPILRLIPDPLDPSAGCRVVGQEFEIRIEVGFSQAVLSGGQFFVGYDPNVLRFVGAEPGQAADPSSAFSVEFFESLNAASGRVFHAVGVGAGEPGVQGPALLSVLRFQAISACATDELCFFNQNPQTTLLTDSQGMAVPTQTECSPVLRFDNGPPLLACPTSSELNAEAGEVTATVRWNAIAVDDACDDVEIECTTHHEEGAAIGHLLSTGGRFPRGRSDFSCSTVDSCGQESACAWHVDVADANGVEVELQLSPSMARQAIRRCIEFEFFANCVEGPEVIQRVVEFGGPFDLYGRASEVRFKVPPGRYECVTARDPLHTVRAVSELAIVDGRYVAQFHGDPFFDGNWLIGGNLDGNHVIDIIDFGIFLGQYLTRRDPHVPCPPLERHADFNGDGIVDQLDFTFIRRNFLEEDKNACCPGTVAALPPATTRVPLGALDDLGLGDLSIADLNRDGRLDERDLAAFEAGARPTKPRSPRKSDR